MKNVYGLILGVIVTPFILVAVLIGFRQCWQCHEVKHVRNMKKYNESMFETKPIVCKECFGLLNTRL